MLTPAQRKTLLFLISYQAENGGVSPTFEDIREHLGISSKSGVHRLMEALDERGFINRLKAHARAIEVLKLPDGSPVRMTRPGAGQPQPQPQRHGRIITIPAPGKLPIKLAYLCPDGKIGSRR